MMGIKIHLGALGGILVTGLYDQYMYDCKQVIGHHHLTWLQHAAILRFCLDILQ
jgi:hypothetical protein